MKRLQNTNAPSRLARVPLPSGGHHGGIHPKKYFLNSQPAKPIGEPPQRLFRAIQERKAAALTNTQTPPVPPPPPPIPEPLPKTVAESLPAEAPVKKVRAKKVESSTPKKKAPLPKLPPQNRTKGK